MSAPSVFDGYPSMAMSVIGDCGPGFAEIWRSPNPVVSGSRAGLAFAHDGDFLFCCGQTGAASDYFGPTEQAYLTALGLMRELGYPQLVRVWNMVNGINEPARDGDSRYARFCQGRGSAFRRTALETGLMPAATGVGCHEGGVSFYFLAARSAEVTHVENPLQVPAYRYPRCYGPTPPSFARATYVANHHVDGTGRLFISGTASILGSDTVHEGDLAGQCDVTLTNISALISAENLVGHGIHADLTLRDIDQVKVYVKPGVDAETVRRACADAFSSEATVTYVGVDICRADLLVEIEGVVSRVESSSAVPRRAVVG